MTFGKPKAAASISVAEIVIVIRERYLNIVIDLSRPKSLPILCRGNERLYHFGLLKVPVELIQLLQPKVVTGIIVVLAFVCVAAQIAEVFHQHEGAIEFGVV